MSSTTAPNPPADREQAPLNDQQRFDAAVNRNVRILLQILGGVAIFAALVMSTIALVLSGRGRETTVAGTMPMRPGATAAATPSAARAPMVRLSVTKKESDGKKHDAFSKTDFAVKVGQPTRLLIDNTDDMPHTITAPATGVNITVRPGVHTYTMVATKAGRFRWVCVLPCDGGPNGWAMSHAGYMAGFITAS